MGDAITISILDDGTIKTETDKVSMPNHQSAERFLLDVGRLAGGTVTKEHKHGGTWHTHAHDHEHEHGNELHQH